MGFNPMEMMQFATKLKDFNERHPRVMPFFRETAGKFTSGSVVELKLTDPENKEYVTNIRLTDEDVELIRSLLAAKK